MMSTVARISDAPASDAPASDGWQGSEHVWSPFRTSRTNESSGDMLTSEMRYIDARECKPKHSVLCQLPRACVTKMNNKYLKGLSEGHNDDSNSRPLGQKLNDPVRKFYSLS